MAHFLKDILARTQEDSERSQDSPTGNPQITADVRSSKPSVAAPEGEGCSVIGDRLELIGEREPLISPLSMPVSGKSGDVLVPAEPHLYEYQWTLDYRVLGTAVATQAAAPVVRLQFPLSVKWRVQEYAAFLKHLTPLEVEETLRQEIVNDWNTFAPALGGVSRMAADAVGVPQAGTVLQTLTRLKLNSFPQGGGPSRWFVKRVHEVNSPTPFRGVEWYIAPGLLFEVGGSITGSLVISFVEYDGNGAEPEPEAPLVGRIVLPTQGSVSASQRQGDAHLGLHLRAGSPVAENEAG